MKSNIVFFGTGDTSLDALVALQEEFIIEAIITKPDSLSSSGKLIPTQISAWADSHNIQCFKPASKAELSGLFTSHKFQSQLGVVLDYGIIIPIDVIEYFEFEIVNSHFSLLPKYRGADPIRSCILNGDKSTGVTIMKIVEELDAGPILTWSEFELDDKINAIELRDKLSELNCALLPETIKLYLNVEIEEVSQDDQQATYTKKVTKEDGLLDPTKSATQLEREIRAYIGWPRSYFFVDQLQITIHQAKVTTVKTSAGKLSIIDKKLYFGAKDRSLEILKIQPAGKPVMDSQSFINGYKNLIS